MEERSVVYEIWTEGHLAPHRLRHFHDIVVRQEAGGKTVLVCSLRDQAALYGLLAWLQRLGVTLLLVRRSEDQQCCPGDATR